MDEEYEVQEIGGQISTRLTGKLAAMVRFLIDNRQELQAKQKGSVVFDFAGKSLKPKVTYFFD